MYLTMMKGCNKRRKDITNKPHVTGKKLLFKISVTSDLNGICKNSMTPAVADITPYRLPMMFGGKAAVIKVSFELKNNAQVVTTRNMLNICRLASFLVRSNL